MFGYVLLVALLALMLVVAGAALAAALHRPARRPVRRSGPAAGVPQPVPGEAITALIGPTGAGKSSSLVAVMDTVHQHTPGVVVAGASAALLRQHHRVAAGRNLGRSPALYEGEAPDAYEALWLREDDGSSRRIEAWAGEDRLIDEGQDLSALMERLRGRGVHRLLLCSNPFRDCPRVAEWALFEMAWMWQERGAFDLRQAVAETAKRLWGATEKGLGKLYTPWEKLAEEMAGARLIRRPVARFGRPVAEAFQVDGVPEERAAAILTGLRRVVQIVSALAGPDVRLMRELARAWPDTVVVVTHAGYLTYLPGLSHGDLKEYGCSLYPNPEAARLSQVVTQESLDLTLSGDPNAPCWIEGPRPEAHDLLAAVRRPLAALPLTGRPSPRAASGAVPPALVKAAPWLVGAGLAALGALLIWAEPAVALGVMMALLIAGVAAVLAVALRPASRPAPPPARPAAEVPESIARRARPVDVAPNGAAHAAADSR